MSIEEVLILRQVVVIANLHQCLVGDALSQAAQSCSRQSVQRPPADLVFDTAHVEHHSAVALSTSNDGRRARRRLRVAWQTAQ